MPDDINPPFPPYQSGPRMRKRSLLAFAVPLIAGCADLTTPAAAPVGPTPAPMGAPGRAEAVLVGTFSAPNAVPLPGEPPTSYLRPVHSGITVKPNSYVLLRISGTLRAEHNPYRLGSTPGQIVATYTPVEARESTGRGNTVVWLRRSGGKAPPDGGELLSYYFRPDNAERDVMLLVAGGAQPAEIWAGRELMPGSQRQHFYCARGFPYCQGSGVGVVLPDTTYKPSVWIEDYWVVESHVLTATEIPEPLVVETPPTVAPGGTVTATARPWGDLRLRDRNGTRADVKFLWYPNDTTETHNPNLPAHFSCSTGTSCTFQPTTSGRLRAWSHVEGALIEVDKIIRVQQQRLQLSCPDSVQRGSTMQCTVAAVPAGTLDSVRWTFVDSAGNTVRDSGRVAWGGTMVVGGRISVSAKLNGLTLTNDTSIVVTPRAWTSPVPPRRELFMRCQTLSSTCFQLYPPTHEGHLGSRVFSPRGMRVQDRAATVTDGPNTGWSYLSGTDSPVVFSEHLIVLNDILKLDNNEDVANEFWSERPQCDRATVLAEVGTHERHHADLFDRRRHILNAEVEREVAFVSAYEWRTRLLRGGEIAVRIAKRIHQIAGGEHRPEDGFANNSCDFELLPNP